MDNGRLSLAAFAATLQTATVTLRGRAVTVHALCALEEDAIERVFARPTPPLRRPANTGSLADPVPDLNDPAFRAEVGAWSWKKALVEFAVCLRLDGVPTASDTTFVDAARAIAAEVEKTFSGAEIERVLRAARDAAEGRVSAGGDPAAEALWRADDGAADEADGVAVAGGIPDRYLVTRRYLLLRIAERFGMHPRDVDGLSAGEQRVLLEYERLREHEEIAACAAR